MSKKIRFISIFNRATIRQQLYIIYAAVIVVPMLLLGTFLLLYTGRIMVDYYTDLLKSENHRVRNLLFELTTDTYNVSKDIVFDLGIRKILTENFDSTRDYMKAVDQNALLEQCARNYTEFSAVEIYTDNPTISDYKQFVCLDEDVMNTIWYQEAISEPGIHWRAIPWEYGYHDEYWSLCLVRAIPLINSPYHAVLVIHLDENDLRLRVDNDEYLCTLSVDRGPVFYSSDRSRYGKAQPMPVDFEEPSFQYTGATEMDNKRYLINISTFYMFQSDSRIYVCTLDSQGYANIRRILYLCGIIIALNLVIPGVMIHFFTKHFAGRVNVLREEMHKASNQDYELISTFQGNDELSEAFDDLQIMVRNIKEQEARAYEAQLKEQKLLISQQEMEFKMLASQINPHFLYNTLETIRMKALKAGDKEAATAIKLLGKSMRYVLENMGTAMTTLEEELNHVEEYIAIQHLRFGDRIQYTMETEPGLDLKEYYLPPLLLQPVVENAIVHGLEEKDEDGRIAVSVYRKISEGMNLLIIDVEDNGCGMTEEVLGKLRTDIEIRDMSRSKSIGLYNINQRMKLHFGDGYRVHIYSEPQMGTRVRLMFPIDRMQLE